MRLGSELAAIHQLHPLRGRVEVRAWAEVPIVVVVLAAPEHPGGSARIVDYEVLHEPGPYSFVVEPGRVSAGGRIRAGDAP